MSEAEVMDAQVVGEEPGTELATVAPANLFRSDDPATVLERAQATANALMPVVRAQGLIAKIQGRDHLTVEAWLTLGAMLGVTPVCVWTRRVEDPAGWEARVEARTLDGRVIGAAESRCDRGESTWAKRDEHALKSMAQTRATSKALASVLRFVATLAGFAGTPAEEMPREPGKPTEKQVKYARTLIGKAKVTDDEKARAGAALGHLSGPAVSKLIESLKGGDNEVIGRMLAAYPPPSDVPANTEGLDPAPVPDDEALPF